MYKQIFALGVSIACSACAIFDTDKYDKLLEKQAMVLVPHTGEHAISRKPGFVIYMKPELANKINAPKSSEFINLLNAQLAVEEEKNGRPLCENGYEIIDKYDFVYYFRIMGAECRINGVTH